MKMSQVPAQAIKELSALKTAMISATLIDPLTSTIDDPQFGEQSQMLLKGLITLYPASELIDFIVNKLDPESPGAQEILTYIAGIDPGYERYISNLLLQTTGGATMPGAIHQMFEESRQEVASMRAALA